MKINYNAIFALDYKKTVWYNKQDKLGMWFI